MSEILAEILSDVSFVAAAVVFFTACAGFVYACARWMEE